MGAAPMSCCGIWATYVVGQDGLTKRQISEALRQDHLGHVVGTATCTQAGRWLGHLRWSGRRRAHVIMTAAISARIGMIMHPMRAGEYLSIASERSVMVYSARQAEASGPADRGLGRSSAEL